jgi:hypothetical protein
MLGGLVTVHKPPLTIKPDSDDDTGGLGWKWKAGAATAIAFRIPA